MQPNTKLDVVLCWHMHQPEYRDLQTQTYQQPWTYLHAIKDYADMAALLENNKNAKAVVNFTPILLEQINNYIEQIRNYIYQQEKISDLLLASLVAEKLPDDMQTRTLLLKACIQVNEKHTLKRFKPLRKLVRAAKEILKHPDDIHYVSDQYIKDLVTWYHIAWMGESLQQSSDTVKHLIIKHKLFNKEDRLALLHTIYQTLESLLPRYKKLYENKQVELATTPYAHPITPLLHDIEQAQDAIPDIVLPNETFYPEGKERAKWHIEQAITVFENCFSHKPNGFWPSEGGLDQESLQVFSEHGLQWTASGEKLLRNSLDKENRIDEQPGNPAHYLYQDKSSNMHVLFRDDGISDAIGFQYSHLSSQDAVDDLLTNLENIANSSNTGKNNIVSIIMDGENAWEYYPENGFPFLTLLYKELSDHPQLNLTTFNESIQGKLSLNLPNIVSGSWVHGTFSTWIGENEKNYAWDLLINAKKTYDDNINNDELSAEDRKKATLQLAICEGSDWFWWFGDYNPGNAVNSFDSLFRMHLKNLYLNLKQTPPAALSKPFNQSTGKPANGGVMRQSAA